MAHSAHERRGPPRYVVARRSIQHCPPFLLGRGGSAPTWLPFVITESGHNGREVRLTLAGELDLASCARLQDRLEEVAQPGVSVRLDLSRLDFIDSGGLHVLIDAFQVARRDGWHLELEPALRAPVRRAIEIVGVDELFWPSAQGRYRARTRPAPRVGGWG